MDNKRFLIIVGLSLIVILFFCNDILEGSTNISSTVDRTRTTSGEGGTQDSKVDVDINATESSTGGSQSSQSSISNVSSDISMSTTNRTEGDSSEENNNETEVFGVDCVNNCSEYFHKCSYEKEETNIRGQTSFVEHFDKIENCPNGEIPEQSCDDPDWGCKKCNEGYYRDKNNICNPLKDFFSSAFSSVFSCILSFVIVVILIVKM